MSSDRNNDNPNLPSWLRDVPLPPRPREDNAAPPPPPAPQPGDALPAWLRERPAEEAAAIDAPKAPGTPAPTEELPAWLRELGDEPAASSTTAPPPGDQAAIPPAIAANELPAWLRDAAPAAPAANTDTSLPGWLRDTGDSEASAPALPEANDVEPTELPDWLREVQERTPAPGEPLATSASAPADTSSEATIPGLLADVSDNAAPPAPPPAAEEATLPSWLRNDVAPRETTPNEPVPPPAAEEATLPGWLHSDSAPEVMPSVPGPAPDAEEDALPSWLREDGVSVAPEFTENLAPFSFDDPGSASSPSPASWLANDLGTAEESMPTWLSSSATEDRSEPAPADTPSWVHDRADSEQPPQPPVEGGADEQASLGSPVEPSVAAPEPLPDNDIPDWLRAASTTLPPPAGDVPAWLQDTSAPPDAPMPPAGDVPAWLQDTSAPPDAPTPPAGDVPAWLQDTSAPPDAPANDVPAWLQPTSSAAPPETAAAVPPADEPLPDWLRDTAATAPSPPAADDLPAWLQAPAPPVPLAPQPAADELPPWLRDDAGAPLPMAAAPGDANLPSWLHGVSTDLPAATTPIAQTSDNAPIQEAASAAATNDLVGGVELPAWLRPTESEPPKEEINATDARSLDWLTKLGAQEEDEADATAPAATPRLRPPAMPARSPAQVEAISLLQQLAAEPYPASATASASAVPSIWRRIGVERLLYVLLLIAALAAFLVPAPTFLGITDPPSAPGAPELFAKVDALTANDIVLVAYEWDARRSGELRPLEQAVFDHLIAHKVKLVLLSTDPQGSLLLYDLRDKLGAAGYKPSGEDYILLGYKPGAELALRAIAQNFPAALRSDFQGNDASRSVLATTPDRQLRLQTMSDFSMIMVLGDEAADVQGWMEQVRPSARHPDGSYVPMAFLLPAEAEPIVQPYLNQPNVLHLAGKQGALAYQQLYGVNGASLIRVTAETSQQRFSLLLYLALLVIGAVVVGLYSAANRGRNRT